MNKLWKKVLTAGLAGTMVFGLVACGSSDGESGSGKDVKMTFQIWDTGQKEGMEAMVAAYEEEHPDVSIEVQVTNWDEYFTKLEAAATSNTMPAI